MIEEYKKIQTHNMVKITNQTGNRKYIIDPSAAQDWFDKDSRTLDFLLGLLVFIMIRMTSHRMLRTNRGCDLNSNINNTK